ncbi:MAG: isochorismatase [Thermoleophilia bacterium]|nr:isochorismatase [Thermoleophilia bacterium]
MTLPLPPHYDPARVGELWRVAYEERAAEASRWAAEHSVRAAADDPVRVCLVCVDVQNTFCMPEFELFVGGRSGTGAIDDNRRLCEFLYRHLDVITEVVPTLDTHVTMQIFHAVWLVDEDGNHPPAYTLVTVPDVMSGRWRANPAVARALGFDESYLQRFLVHYVSRLARGGKYALTVWPYHAMLGGIGHALVPSVEEAVFFHSLARHSQPDFRVKGNRPLTEHYSVLGPEVADDHEGQRVGEKNQLLIDKLLEFDAVLIAGQAKSHCVAWTIDDLLTGIGAAGGRMAERVYLLEDCTSPVVVPGVIDYTDEAEAAFRRFADAGMHVVRSTDPIERWLEPLAAASV